MNQLDESSWSEEKTTKVVSCFAWQIEFYFVINPDEDVMQRQRHCDNKRAYLTTDSKQNVENNNSWEDHGDNFGMVIPDRRPESQHQNWARQAQSHHDGEPA